MVQAIALRAKTALIVLALCTERRLRTSDSAIPSTRCSSRLGRNFSPNG